MSKEQYGGGGQNTNGPQQPRDQVFIPWLQNYEDEEVLPFLMMVVVDDVCLRVDDVDRHCCRATKVVDQVE